MLAGRRGTNEVRTYLRGNPSASRVARLVRLALTAIGLFLLFALFAPGRAEAADYSVVECEPGQDWAADFWNGASSGAAIERINWCGPAGATTGWGLALRQQGGVPYTGFAHWSINAPAGLRFSRLLATAHVYYAASMTPQYYTDNHGFRTIGAWNPNDPEFWYAIEVGDFSTFGVYLVCGWNPQCVGYQLSGPGDTRPAGAYAYLQNVQLVLDDQVTPTVEAAGGSLLSGGTKRGRETVAVDANDLGGGLRGFRIYVNGVLSQGPDYCPPSADGRYRQIRPCPSSLQKHLEVDTEREPGWTSGPNDVRICSFDVSGQDSGTCIRNTVHVDNSCPASGGATPAFTLDAGIDTGRGETRFASVRSTEDVVVRGRIRDSAGGPIKGANVCVFETIDLDDASRELVATATTQSNGRFATQLDRGPSRELDVVYRYNNQVLRDEAKVRSSVVPTFAVPRKTLRNGQAALFAGTLPGPRAGSRSVALQARVGKKWRTFKQLTTDSRGRFRGKYKFLSTVGTVRYRFRALVKRQGGYPYEPGASRKARVLVRG